MDVSNKPVRTLFVSYNFTSNDGRVGFGNSTQFTTSADSINASDILHMQATLEKEQDFKRAVILSYQFM